MSNEQLTQTKSSGPVAEFRPRPIQQTSFLDALKAGMEAAVIVSKSGWCSKGCDKPEQIALTLAYAARVGMDELTALQSVAVINGRPSIYGDAALALVRASGLMVDYKVEYSKTTGKDKVDTEADSYGVTVTIQRKGFDPASESYTVADAKRAKLWKKPGPWTEHPKRMLMWRARGFLLRDQFGDVLKGMQMRDQMEDIDPADHSARFKAAKPVDDMPEDTEPTPIQRFTEFFDEHIKGNREGAFRAWMEDHSHIEKGATIFSVDDKAIEYLLGDSARHAVIKLFGKNAKPPKTESINRGVGQTLDA